MNNRWYWSLVLLIAIAGLATSCAAPAVSPATPTTVASPTSLPKPTAAPATATAVPTATAQPATPTSVPTATAQPATATRAPTVTSQSATATSSPAASAQPTTATSSSGQSGKVDLDKIMPAGKGRDLLFNNCTSCHSFVCAIQGQRPVGAWQTIKLGHRERVSGLSDDDYNALFDYLAANFNDKKPAPELPPALQDLGCQAQ